MPEIGVRTRKTDADVAPVALFPHGSDVALNGFRRHVIEKVHGLARLYGSVQDHERTVRAQSLCVCLELNQFAFRIVELNDERYLKRNPHRTTTLGTPSELHNAPLAKKSAKQGLDNATIQFSTQE